MTRAFITTDVVYLLVLVKLLKASTATLSLGPNWFLANFVAIFVTKGTIPSFPSNIDVTLYFVREPWQPWISKVSYEEGEKIIDTFAATTTAIFKQIWIIGETIYNFEWLTNCILTNDLFKYELLMKHFLNYRTAGFSYDSNYQSIDILYFLDGPRYCQILSIFYESIL